MDQLGKKTEKKIEEACPACGMRKSKWPDTGIVVNGTTYCCLGCAEGTGCTCRRILGGEEREGAD